MQTFTFISALVIATIFPIQSRASFKEHTKDAQIKESPTPDTSKPQIIIKPAPDTQPLIISSAKQLKEVEDLISENKSIEANSLAKSIANNIKHQTGIDPKAKLQEVIPSRTVFVSGEDLKTRFSQLKNLQQVAITEAVRNHMNGNFLDILNLSKRANLLYIKVAYKILKDEAYRKKRNGQLTKTDLDFLKEQLLEIYSIPILVSIESQENSYDFKDPYLIFDMDIIRTDQQFWFQKEILEFINDVEIWKNKQNEFLQELNAYQRKQWESYIGGLQELQKNNVRTVNEYRKILYKTNALIVKHSAFSIDTYTTKYTFYDVKEDIDFIPLYCANNKKNGDDFFNCFSKTYIIHGVNMSNRIKSSTPEIHRKDIIINLVKTTVKQCTEELGHGPAISK